MFNQTSNATAVPFAHNKLLNSWSTAQQHARISADTTCICHLLEWTKTNLFPTGGGGRVIAAIVQDVREGCPMIFYLPKILNSAIKRIILGLFCSVHQIRARRLFLVGDVSTRWAMYSAIVITPSAHRNGGKMRWVACCFTGSHTIVM